jgi:hypothetical protein
LYLSEINCTQREINSSRWAAYSSDREIIKENTFLSSWKPSIPGTVGEDLFNEVCSKKNK